MVYVLIGLSTGRDVWAGLRSRNIIWAHVGANMFRPRARYKFPQAQESNRPQKLRGQEEGGL